MNGGIPDFLTISLLLCIMKESCGKSKVFFKMVKETPRSKGLQTKNSVEKKEKKQSGMVWKRLH